jgi:hypothetical protein
MIDVNLSRKSNGVGQHDQIIHFINGSKRYIQGVLYIWENEMTHIVDYLGVEYIVNKSNVLFVERISKGGDGNGKTDAVRSREGRCARKRS